MSNDQSVYERLKARFDHHQTRKQGGRDLLYVSGEQVIGRLNDVLGFDGWSFEVKDVKVLEDEVWASGRMTVYVGERTIVREQTGGQIINRTRGIPAQPARPAQEADGDRPAIPAAEAKPAVKGEIIEVANDIKGAVTDTLKKCATLFGVGAYLYDESERREVEAEMRGANRPKAPAATNAASPGTQASRSASTPSISSAAPSTSSTTATAAQQKVHDSSVLTGATPINQQTRWSRLVAEAERIKLPTLGQVKAIDPKAVSTAQLKSYGDLLETRIYEATEAVAV